MQQAGGVVGPSQELQQLPVIPVWAAGLAELPVL
jgi:hypothetical protein